MGAEVSRGERTLVPEEFGLPVPRHVLFLGCPRHHLVEGTGEAVAGDSTPKRRHRLVTMAKAVLQAPPPPGFRSRVTSPKGSFGSSGSLARSTPRLSRSSLSSANLLADTMLMRGTSETSDISDMWGFFETHDTGDLDVYAHGPQGAYLETPAYILEEPLAVQALWHVTAGRRPKQPDHERHLIEQEWEKNFQRSEVAGLGAGASQSLPQLSQAESPPELRRTLSASRIVQRLTCPYGYAASKSFSCPHCDNIASVMIHVPRVRVLAAPGRPAYAEFLIVVDNGTFTFGIWRRYSAFTRFYNSMVRGDCWNYPRTIASWRELQAKRKWTRCLQRDYLLVKCFHIERLLQSLLAEAETPDILSSLVFGGGSKAEVMQQHVSPVPSDSGRPEASEPCE